MQSGLSKLETKPQIAVLVTFGALALFVVLGAKVTPLLFSEGQDWLNANALVPIFVLNIALILFGWRKAVQSQRSHVEELAAAERRAHDAAYVDHTTGLTNRRGLFEALQDLRKAKGFASALLLLDLDHFKRVNDLYGHATGDRLLATCSSIIREEVPSGACAARLGGDEFAILLHGAEEVTAERVAQNILRRFAEGLVLGDTFAHVSASIGGSLVQHQQVQPEEALRRSDIAMYEAKARGRKRFVWFDKTMETALNKRNELEADIRAGVDAGQFVPYYQPLVHLNTGEIKGFEVLARWQHPRLGVVQPESFVPLAEASNLIGDISFSVMRQAFIQAKSWPDAITLAVNVSPVQFKDPLLASRVVQLLTATGFPAQRLEIEITESAIFDDGQLALETVESLKNSGIRISLDDFGTGYASLTQLRAIPFDRIKIDRSFVACMLEDQQSGAIVSTIAKLGGSLCLPITAEGVETEAVRKVLQRLGCSDAQGWLFGKAMPAEEAARLIGGPPFESAPVPTGPELVVGHNERRDQKRRARGQQAAA